MMTLNVRQWIDNQLPMCALSFQPVCQGMSSTASGRMKKDAFVTAMACRTLDTRGTRHASYTGTSSDFHIGEDIIIIYNFRHKYRVSDV